MRDADRAEVARRARAAADTLLLRRMRLTLVFVLAVLPLYAVADYLAQQPHFWSLQATKLGILVAGVAIVARVRRPDRRHEARAGAVLMITLALLGSGVSSVLSNHYASHALLCLILPLFVAAFFPYGSRAHGAVIALAVLAAGFPALLIDGAATLLMGYPSIFAAIALASSLLLAADLERTRIVVEEQNLAREQSEARIRDQGKVAAALARVGRELIATMERSALVERLCELTTEVVGCEAALTIMRRSDTPGFVPVAHHGFDPETAASLDVLEIPETWLAPFLGPEARVAAAAELPAAGELNLLAESLGVVDWIAIPLRINGQVGAMHAAGYRTRGHHLSATQRRILVGIANIASLALQNSRLVEDLARANELKSSFVASMSHELRTPLNVILGYNELLLEGVFGALSSEQIDPLRRVQQNARELLDLIDATLDLSRFDQRRVPVAVEPIDIGELLRELVDEAAATSMAGEVRIAFAGNDSLVTIHSDRLKIRMILKNLLHNAIKFTGRGNVTISACNTAHGVEIAVADDGPGIADEELEHIFEAFHQSARGRDLGGIGLGLHLVQRLIHLLGGRVSAESHAGAGATFRIWLPLRVPERVPSEPPALAPPIGARQAG